MSNFPPFDQNPYVMPQVVQKPGMSGVAKVLIVLAIIFLVLIVLCCGGLFLFGFMASRYVEDAITDDPAVIEQRRAEMLEITIPESLKPRNSVDMKVPMSDKRFTTTVVYADPSHATSVVLVGLGEIFMEMPEEDKRRQIDESLHQQGVRQHEADAGWESKPKEFTIGGKPTMFVYRTKKDENGEPERIEATGTVAGKRGPVMVMIFADANEMNEEEIDQIVRSIR